MSVVINILVTLALCFWGSMMMMSPMMFGAPGATNNKQAVLTALLFLSYPVPLFLLIGLFGGSYFGINSYKMALISVVVIGFLFTIFGYTSMVKNLLQGIANGGYCVVEQRVYYNAKLMEHADAESFISYSQADLNTYDAQLYAKDKQHLYYSGQTVSGVYLENLHAKIIGSDLYWLNDTQVIKGERIVEGADPSTYAAYDYYSFWNISGHEGNQVIYHHDEPMHNIDAQSFVPIDDSYGKDGQHIFYQGLAILADVDIDTASFSRLDENFASDNQYIFYLNGEDSHILIGAEPANFELFERNYYRSGEIVYYVTQYESAKPMPQIHAASFTVTQYDEQTNSDAYDKNNYYLRGEVVVTR
ncbi:DKNYY domain-containing protein [Pseudoalteromonas sp. SG44-8]|uniref:DKNYY domain-containing protein n=1 Tax=Pseudoalteromonas sp. SG44-8 TaxID=2760958 RepID=UPI001603958E|nr:DKNYY domain-containing protein [Pseudoalteromonas sp. SG44-8]MBB1396973.1 DKNYY domain-containing protein [Pseudoalteromonas sp. SG44-8]